jgi:hypothetical protein
MVALTRCFSSHLAAVGQLGTVPIKRMTFPELKTCLTKRTAISH